MKAIKHILILAIVATTTFAFVSCGDDTYVPEDIVEIETPGTGEEPGEGEEPGGVGEEPGGEPSDLPTAVYFLSFEDTNDDVQIIGKGEFIEIEDAGFGRVFRNSDDGRRENYLLLPSDILSYSATTMEMSIGMWVNSSTATKAYLWAPLFTAYAAAPENGQNGSPMLAFQYRGVLQINCNGWTDFTDEQNVAGKNKLWHGELDPLADGNWHYYTATFTETTAKVYIDGEIANEWVVSGEGGGNTIKGLFTNGSELKYICLGGNQAWNFGDDDNGFMYDDLAIYDKALTSQEIEAIIKAK